MVTEKEILNVVSSLAPEEAATEIKRMIDEEVEFIFKSVTLNIAEEYKPGDTRRALRDYYLTVKEIDRVWCLYDKAK